MRFRLPISIAAALVAVLVFALPAAAKAPKVRFGAGAWSFPSSRDFDELTPYGLKTWRLTMSWSDVSPSASVMNFSGYDQVMNLAASRGIDVLVDLTGCPAWSCPRGGAPRTRASRAGFVRFVREAVRRYGHTSGLAVPVTYWQVLNEINGSDQWGAYPRARGYVRVLKPAATAIRATDPAAKIVVGGLGEKMTVWLKDYLRRLYRVRGFKRSFDVIAPEGYAVRPRDVPGILRLTRRIMRRHHDAKKPMFITEMGWSTPGGPWFPFTVSPERQAKQLRASWRVLAACGKRWKLRRVYWFSYADIAPARVATADYWGLHNGLIDPGGQRKPAWTAFTKFLNPKRKTGRCRLRR